MIINHAGTEESLPDLADGVSLPILQDTSTEDVFDQYGASKWYVYLIDSQGIPRTIHYSLDLDNERERLLSDIAALVKEAK